MALALILYFPLISQAAIAYLRRLPAVFMADYQGSALFQVKLRP